MSFFSFANWSANDVVVLEGNSERNYLSGSYAKDILRGENGNDTYHIGPGDITAVDGDPSATGNALPNKLVGGMRNNVLNGLGGEDVMQGRAGNDTYVVDTLNDIVDEAANNPGGIDTSA